MSASREPAPVEPYSSPERSPEVRDGFPPVLRRDDWFTAFLLPIGAISGVILLFALWTTDRLVIPGYTHKAPDADVTLFGVTVGSTELAHPAVWGIALLLVFTIVGAAIGLLAGRLIGRLAHLGT